MPRPHLDYLLFDLPADHEIEGDIVTEGQVIESIIANRRRANRRVMNADLKRMRIASVARFKETPRHQVTPCIVHLTCHGGVSGINLLGGDVPWNRVGQVITKYLMPLKWSVRGSLQKKRVMIFSCCHSREGFDATRPRFAKFFSGAYFFEEDIRFHDALAVWSMFYLKVSPGRPHGAIKDEPNVLDQINGFLGARNKLVFHSYDTK